MRSIVRRGRIWAIFLITSLIPVAGSAQEYPWTLTHDIALTTQVRIAGVLREEHVTADLYRPLAEGRVPAAVFTSGSGGVGSAVELYYARVLARQGMASLVIDSFQPRGVLRTSQDQTVVRMQQQTADAVAGFRWLAAQPNIDPTRIVVIGLSRGGTVATDLALEQRRRAQHQLQSSEVRFAAHVGIAPDCVWQLKDARTTGAPIYFVLSEFDEFTPGCIDYADRIRAAGNPNVRIAVYPGVYHVLEATGGPVQVNDIRDAKCTGRYLFDTDFTVIDRANGRRVALPKDSEQLWREKCAELRDHINGGDLRIRAQATEDLLQFLRDIESLIDAKARAVVPDCKSIPEGFFRLNCARARSGWVGDLVALGQAFRTGRLPRDPILARRLFGLAAERGHSTAQAALANMYLDGDGGPRDFAAAHSYAQLAAAADEQGAAASP